ncbi:MAG: hypothetical protein K2G85_10500 [Muribaculaceae bacterium]|nr:hypothetical protein [Muribaculaceae bacterium]
MSKTYDRWEFIEKWLPDYTSNAEVAYSDDLECYIHGETESSRYKQLQEEFPDIEDAIEEQKMIDFGLFTEAYRNYAKRPGKTESQEYKIAVLRDLWEFFGCILVTDDDEIESDFMDFQAGTSRLEVWSWFDEKCPNGLAIDLLGETSKK